MSMVTVLDLPSVIISDIWSRLPIEDIFRCRCVCKTWNELTMEPSHMDIQQRIQQQTHYLLLQPDIYQPLYLIKNTTTTSTNHKCRVDKIAAQGIHANDMRIAGSCNGLLCLVPTGKEMSPIFIYNPITKEKLELPKPLKKIETHSPFEFGFGFDQESGKYKVILLGQSDWSDNRRHTCGMILTVGENSWRELQFGRYDSKNITISTVFLNGYFHWIINNGWWNPEFHLLALKISNEKFDIISFPQPTGMLDISSDIFQSTMFGDLSWNFSKKWKLMNLGESLSLVSEPAEASSMEIWQVKGTQIDGTRWFYKYGFDAAANSDGTRWPCKLLGILSDGSFLMAVKGELCTYEPGTKQLDILDSPTVDPITMSCEAFSFIPSFISPFSLHS